MGKILARVVRRAARPLAAATSRNRPSPGQLPGRACPAPTGWCSVDIPPTDCCRGRRPRRPAEGSRPLPTKLRKRPGRDESLPYDEPADSCPREPAGGIYAAPTMPHKRNPGAFYMRPCPFAASESFPGGYGIRPCGRGRRPRRPGPFAAAEKLLRANNVRPYNPAPKTTAARSGLTPERAAVFLSNDYCISPHTSCA